MENLANLLGTYKLFLAGALIVTVVGAIWYFQVQSWPQLGEVKFDGQVKSVTDRIGYTGWLVEVFSVTSGQGIQLDDQIWVGYGSYPPLPGRVDEVFIGAFVSVYGKLEGGEVSLNGKNYYIINLGPVPPYFSLDET